MSQSHLTIAAHMLLWVFPLVLASSVIIHTIWEYLKGDTES
jgi:hypothetical protein